MRTNFSILALLLSLFVAGCVATPLHNSDGGADGAGDMGVDGLVVAGDMGVDGLVVVACRDPAVAESCEPGRTPCCTGSVCVKDGTDHFTCHYLFVPNTDGAADE